MDATKRAAIIGVMFALLLMTGCTTKKHQISGTVSGAVKAGVSVSLTGQTQSTAVTDSAGAYSFASLEDGNYEVTPSLMGYAFNPTGRSVKLSGADVTGTDFTAQASAQTHRITGTVSGAVQAGVTVALALRPTPRPPARQARMRSRGWLTGPTP